MSHSAAENVGVAAPPSVATQVACLAPDLCSKSNNTAGSDSMLVHDMQVPMTMQDASVVFKEIPLYDVYEEYVTACLMSCLHSAVDIAEVDTEQVDVKVENGKPIISREIPTGGIFSLTNEKKFDTELLAVCFNNASNHAFSEEATNFAFPHGPVIHADKSINLTNEKSTHVAPILCVHEAILHFHDERSEISIKKHEVLIKKHGITSPGDLNNDKELSFVLEYQLPRRSAPCIWDPGIDLFSYKKLHLFSWIPHSDILFLQQSRNTNISSMWELSFEKEDKRSGIQVSNSSYMSFGGCRP